MLPFLKYTIRNVPISVRGARRAARLYVHVEGSRASRRAPRKSNQLLTLTIFFSNLLHFFISIQNPIYNK